MSVQKHNQLLSLYSSSHYYRVFADTESALVVGFIAFISHRCRDTVYQPVKSLAVWNNFSPSIKPSLLCPCRSFFIFWCSVSAFFTDFWRHTKDSQVEQVYQSLQRPHITVRCSKLDSQGWEWLDAFKVSLWFVCFSVPQLLGRCAASIPYGFPVATIHAYAYYIYVYIYLKLDVNFFLL